MRKHLFEGMFRSPLTETAPLPDDAAMAELAAGLDRAARRRLGLLLDAGSPQMWQV
jgi:hypothetical protein